MICACAFLCPTDDHLQSTTIAVCIMFEERNLVNFLLNGNAAKTRLSYLIDKRNTRNPCDPNVRIRAPRILSIFNDLKREFMV